jgi:glycosyltransferase involved in cell wall biosynthesis
MKIALVHDYLKEYGGAESVLETLSDLFSEAPVYTTLYCPKFFGPHRARLEKKWGSRIHQSFFKYIPFAPKIISPLRLLSPLAFKSFDFSGFDLIISSATGAYFPNSLNKSSAKLICYCHTPPRYLYGLPTARNLTNNKIIRALALFVNHWLRLLDFHWAQNVNLFIANSSTTSSRIQKFYRRDSIVINPPVEVPTASPLSKGEAAEGREGLKTRGGLYLTGGRLARAKRYDIAIAACNKLGLPLKIFGRDFAGYTDELKAMAGSTIEFVGEVSESEKWKLFSGARAYIFPSDNEDFGIVSVESQACGCPVIGFRSGGIAETVIDGQTGVLFDDLTVNSCVAAIKKLEKLDIKPSVCITNAQNFSKEIFISKIKKLTSGF